MGSTDEKGSWTWTYPQRRVLVALLAILCPIFALRYACNRAYVPDPPPPHGPRYDEVADKIDPNTADVATLSALPMIGDRRARDIIDFRESRLARAPGELAFESPEDLLLIKGFGRASVETLRPYLVFQPDSRPSTQP